MPGVTVNMSRAVRKIIMGGPAGYVGGRTKKGALLGLEGVRPGVGRLKLPGLD